MRDAYNFDFILIERLSYSTRTRFSQPYNSNRSRFSENTDRVILKGARRGKVAYGKGRWTNIWAGWKVPITPSWIGLVSELRKNAGMYCTPKFFPSCKLFFVTTLRSQLY